MASAEEAGGTYPPPPAPEDVPCSEQAIGQWLEVSDSEFIVCMPRTQFNLSSRTASDEDDIVTCTFAHQTWSYS